jgi:serine/threonine protein kinase
MAEGILYLHLNKPPILHRDLKSLNILLDEHMSVKVSDFGLTDFKPDQPAENTSNPANNLQFGTTFWLAPEVMQDGQYTEAADVYSFGMIIWELFTREIPFPNMNPHQAALAVITEDKRPDVSKIYNIIIYYNA